MLLQNLLVSGRLRQGGSMHTITGNRPHESSAEAAAIMVYTATDTSLVELLTGDEE
ncbi:hypothetical protein [Acidovorax sp. 1608163]|uniref:hypothetical protein n=1 Tax=Acidovorax sp. 1608163 TaxID=2478662 RepID=UPI0013CF0AB8|nr:hypothetical protein [Acidovorax sp. 1608163]